MKTLITTLFLSLSLFAFAETAHYKVAEGKLHKGGSLTVETVETSNDFVVKTKYEIQKKAWVPVPSEYLKGDYTTTLPSEFQDERGYQDLEAVKEMSIHKAKIRFVKRLDYGNLKGAYQIEILPENGKSKSVVIYHPTVAAVGWAKVEITFISDIALLNGYKIVAEIR